MAKALLERRVAWLDGCGPEAPFVVGCCASLARNVGDFSFPSRCSEEELEEVETRVLSALERSGLLANGQYTSVRELDATERRFVAERHLLPEHWVPQGSAGGVYVSQDQSMAVLVNGVDHVRMLCLTSGLAPQDAWRRLTEMDDALDALLGFAFDERRGYLTASLDEVGTGLALTAFLHLPALTRANKALGLVQTLREKRHRLRALFAASQEGGGGEFYALSNALTLGLAEEELVYHLKQEALDVVSLEKGERAAASTLEHAVLAIEDRVGRALGVARSARLMDFGEALALASSIRLGAWAGLVQGRTWRDLNELVIAIQPAHLEMRAGRECDAFALSVERADLMRAQYS